MEEKIRLATKKLDLIWHEDLEPKRSYTHYPMQPEYITIHNAASPWGGKSLHAYNRRSIAASVDGVKSWHVSCGEEGAFQALPFNTNAWHAGDSGGPGNRSSIGIEIARDLSTDGNLYASAEDNGAKAAACLLYAFDLGLDRLKKHQDWSGKYCPYRILKEGRWESFKARVGHYLEVLDTDEIDTSKNQEPNTVTFHCVQVGAFTSEDNARRFKDQVTRIFEEAGIEIKPYITTKEKRR